MQRNTTKDTSMRAVIVSVDFHDLLSVSLPYIRHHFSDVLVITSKAQNDDKTVDVAQSNNAAVFRTNAFYHGGAPFAKFRALEEGLDSFGRKGWLALIDADILWPKVFQIAEKNLKVGYVYSFKRRRLLLDVTVPIPPEKDWPSLPLDPQYSEIMGFTQIFNCEDPLLDRKPWHNIDLTTAALGDSYFQNKWGLAYKVWLDDDVLHLGEITENWCGRVTKYRDGTTPAKAEDLHLLNKQHKHKLWG